MIKMSGCFLFLVLVSCTALFQKEPIETQIECTKVIYGTISCLKELDENTYKEIRAVSLEVDKKGNVLSFDLSFKTEGIVVDHQHYLLLLKRFQKYSFKSVIENENDPELLESKERFQILMVYNHNSQWLNK